MTNLTAKELYQAAALQGLLASGRLERLREIAENEGGPADPTGAETELCWDAIRIGKLMADLTRGQ